MIEKLEKIKERFEEVSEIIVKPETLADMKYYAQINREYKELAKIVKVYEAYRLLLSNIDNAKEILATEKDPEFRAMAKEELEASQDERETLEEEIKLLLVPKDPNDAKNAILEIRAGTGGDESAIFAGDLFRMYQRYADRQGWRIEITDFNEGDAGGYSKLVANVLGDDVYGRLKYEAGVHRVQRVPATETQGRIHTSAASVTVLPEMDDVEVEINMNDVRVDTFCSSGPGGQSVNTTYSAIRLTHLPTGVVVQCQDEKSQIKNKEKALRELRSRIYNIELQKHNEAVGAERRSMVGSGDRSDKIRTYNYPQGRVTDHRINYTVYNLPSIMNGEVGEFIEQLRIAENAEKLKAGGMVGAA
jgi:peptide chain release factor 1